MGAAQFVKFTYITTRLGQPLAGIAWPLVYGRIKRRALQLGRERVAVDGVPVALAIDRDGLLAC